MFLARSSRSVPNPHILAESSKLQRLPVAEIATRRHLPLAPEARPVDRRWRPRVAVWELTLRCNLACRHCGSRAGAARDDELDREECLELVEQLADLGVMEVSLIGGEAHLHPAFFEVVREFADKNIQVALATGGRNVSAATAERAAESGLRSVSVSVDGLEAVHDRLRGVQGAWASAFRTIDHFRRAGVWVGTNTQINRWTAADLPELLEQLIAAGVRAWQLALTVAMGRAADEPDLLLQPYDLLEVMPMLAQLKERCDEANVRFWPGNNVGYFGPHEATLRGSLPRGHGGGCGAGCVTVGIEANGTIKGCPSLPTEYWGGGSVREHRLIDIWERSEPLRYVRDRTVDELWGFCRTCYYAEHCQGGCTWTAFSLFGRPGNNPYCHHRALEMDRLGLRERVVPLARAPGNPFDHGEFGLVVEPSGAHTDVLAGAQL
jgi:radical SAM protein with 4Fe4S-binding SPASM domain